MTLLNYSFSRGTLWIGRGNKSIEFDSRNALFSPITDLFNSLQPKRIYVYGGVTGKAYLCTLRAIFHSDLESFQITLWKRNNQSPWEDYLYPLSRTFGPELVQSRYRRGRHFGWRRFQVSRHLPNYSYQLGIYLVSDGKDLVRLRASLEALSVYCAPATVLRVICPAQVSASAELRSAYPQWEWIDDSSIYSADTRFPISKKKNLAFDKNDAERVVILHERIRLHAEWVQRLFKNARFFDLYTCGLFTQDGRRYLDKFGIRFAGYPTLKKNHYFLTWKEDNAHQLVDGGLFVIHARALGGHRFDPALHWGEMEDVDLVLRMKQGGSLVSFDSKNKAWSTTDGHFSLASGYGLVALYKIWIRRLSWGYRVARGLERLKAIRG